MKILVCDENVRDRDQTVAMIHALKTQLEEGESITVQACESGRRLLFEAGGSEDMPDIVYLDVNLSDMGGVEVARALRTTNFEGEIIFLTRSKDHWRPAFDVRAYNYIVKDDCPQQRFCDVFRTAVKRVAERNIEYMLFSSCGDVLTVPVRSIRYFEVDKKIITVHYKDGRFKFYSTLKKIEQQLIGRDFVRVHKSYLVSLFEIAKINAYDLYLKDNTFIPIGRNYAKMLKETLQEKSLNISKAMEWPE